MEPLRRAYNLFFANETLSPASFYFLSSSRPLRASIPVTTIIPPKCGKRLSSFDRF